MIQVFEILFPLGSSNFIFDNEDYPVVFLKVTGSVCSLKKKKMSAKHSLLKDYSCESVVHSS